MARASSDTALAAMLAASGRPIPAGHALVTVAERPDLAEPVERFGSAVWPELMLQDPVADAHWPRLHHDLPGYQLVLLDSASVIAAVARSAPLAWDGTLDDLPPGWDAQFARSFDELDRGVAPDTLGAVMIVTDPARRGDGLGGLMVEAILALGRAQGFRALIACVRPTLLERYPLTDIAEYASWTRADGLPFDPWIRIHVRAGGRLSRAEPHSMRISGSVTEWEGWVGMAFPASGRYVVPGAAAPIDIDREADSGLYHDPNVWVIHDL